MSNHESYAGAVTVNGIGSPNAGNTADVNYDLIGHAVHDYPHEKPYSTAIKQQPITEQRKPYVPSSDGRLHDAGTARATIAASAERPNGTQERNYTRNHQHQTVVIQHVDYWDQDGDGIIWPLDTYHGCRAFGWNLFLALFATFLINGALSYPTVPGWLPDPFFRIYTARMYKDKHGSDSMTYDNEGRFKPQNFEDIFAKYDRGNKGGLDLSDLWDFWKGQRMVFDFFGWSATFFEWVATYLLLWPEDGVMRKEDIRGIYDGSIFYRKAEEHQAEMKRRQQQRTTAPSLLAKAQKVLS